VKGAKVILYNPRADFYTLPLALLALGRWRCRRDFYRFPVETTMVEWLRTLAPQG
jgi:hypothetical protein